MTMSATVLKILLALYLTSAGMTLAVDLEDINTLVKAFNMLTLDSLSTTVKKQD